MLLKLLLTQCNRSSLFNNQPYFGDSFKDSGVTAQEEGSIYLNPNTFKHKKMHLSIGNYLSRLNNSKQVSLLWIQLSQQWIQDYIEPEMRSFAFW